MVVAMHSESTQNNKDPVTCQKSGSCDTWRIANSVLIKGKCTKPPLFSGTELLYSASDKVKSFAKNLP